MKINETKKPKLLLLCLLQWTLLFAWMWAVKLNGNCTENCIVVRCKSLLNAYELSDPSCFDVNLAFSHVHKMPFLVYDWKLKSLLLMMIQLLGSAWNSRVFGYFFCIVSDINNKKPAIVPSSFVCHHQRERHSRRFRRVITWWWLLPVWVTCIAGPERRAFFIVIKWSRDSNGFVLLLP